MQTDLIDLTEGALLVLLGFGLTTGVQLWIQKKNAETQRRRILDYVRLELERNRKVAEGLASLLSAADPAKGYLFLSSMADDAWRIAASEWRLTRLDSGTMAGLTDVAQNAKLVNRAVEAYTTYGVTQGAMGNYVATLRQLSAVILAGTKQYLASVERLHLPTI